jgi:hypothetical protein
VRVVIGLYALVEQLAKQCRAAVYVVRAGRPPPVCRRRVARNTRRVPGRPDEALNVCRLSSVGLGRPGRLSVIGEPGLERLDR